MEDSKDLCKSLIPESPQETLNMAKLMNTEIYECPGTGDLGLIPGCANDPCYNVNKSFTQKQHQIEDEDTNLDKDNKREKYNNPDMISNSNYSSLDCRVKCFVCGELVEKQKLSGHLLFGELKCIHCFLEVKTCEQFQAIKSYQTNFHMNTTSNQYNQNSGHLDHISCQQNIKSFPQNQNFCQHKDFVWPISPTPVNFLKENLSNAVSNVNVELCCYISKLSVLASAKPWKVIIQSYWQVKENKSCLYCKKSKQNFTLKAILSRPFKPNLPKLKNKNKIEFYDKNKNLLSKEILTSLKIPSKPSLEPQKTEKNSLLKSILDQPVRYNFDIIHNIHTSGKCNVQDNSVSSSQTQILLV